MRVTPQHPDEDDNATHKINIPNIYNKTFIQSIYKYTILYMMYIYIWVHYIGSIFISKLKHRCASVPMLSLELHTFPSSTIVKTFNTSLLCKPQQNNSNTIATALPFSPNLGGTLPGDGVVWEEGPSPLAPLDPVCKLNLLHVQ